MASTSGVAYSTDAYDRGPFVSFLVAARCPPQRCRCCRPGQSSEPVAWTRYIEGRDPAERGDAQRHAARRSHSEDVATPDPQRLTEDHCVPYMPWVLGPSCTTCLGLLTVILPPSGQVRIVM
jgi:hypothetical protein